MGCLGGCLSRIFWTIVIILVWAIAWLAWLLNWVCWAVFKVLYLTLLVLCLFCASPPSPTTIDIAADVSGSVNLAGLEQAANSGDVGAQFLLAKKSQEIAECDDMALAVASTLSGLPEVVLQDDRERKNEFGRKAEYWYGKVADQGYMLARYEQWWMVLSRWERNIDLWCWLIDNCWQELEKEKL